MKVVPLISPYVAPGIDMNQKTGARPVTITLSVEEAKDFLERVGEYFNVPRFAFFRKKEGGRPRRVYGSISVSEIRKVVAFRLLQETSLSLKEVAEVVGLRDHSSAIHIRNKAMEHIESCDQKFLGMYQVVKRFNLTRRLC